MGNFGSKCGKPRPEVYIISPPSNAQTMHQGRSVNTVSSVTSSVGLTAAGQNAPQLNGSTGSVSSQSSHSWSGSSPILENSNVGRTAAPAESFVSSSRGTAQG